jgi:two-component system nitrogen regulation sensor histidine kinase NtrY
MRVGHPDIDIAAEIKEEPMRAQFDRRLISQALTNIIKNATEAIEAVPPDQLDKGRIDVIAARENEDIVIDVIDNGIGLPKVARARLLEPYVTTREKGTGLGLAIVGRVLEDHGGKIELKDASDFRPGQRGAWMRLRFAVSGQAAKPDVKESGAATAPSSETAPTAETKVPETATSEATTAAAVATEAPASETKAPDAGTVEPAETTNNETKIEAATGN